MGGERERCQTPSLRSKIYAIPPPAGYSKRSSSKAVANYHSLTGGWNDPHCVRQTIQMFPTSLLILSRGWSLIDLPLRASNEGLLRPRVARAQKIIRLHPLPFFSILLQRFSLYKSNHTHHRDLVVVESAVRRALRFLARCSPGMDVCQFLRCNLLIEILLHAEYRRRPSLFERLRHQVEQRAAVT